MNSNSMRTVELCIAWIAPVFAALYLFFWCILGQNLPPPQMLSMSGSELVSQFYAGHQTQIAIGNIGAATVGMLYLPWACLLGSLMRDERGAISVLGYMEITGGALTAWVISMGPAMWAACAIFATSIPPEVLKFAHVATWIVFDTTYMVTTVEMVGLGLYIIVYKHQKIFPGWCAWLNFVVAFLFALLVLIPFVPSGPFAVGGLLNFWLQLVAWLGWMLCMTYFMVRWLSARRSVNSEMPIPAVVSTSST